MAIDKMRKDSPEKFVSEERIFSHIHRGDRIFVGTGCGEPQYLVQSLIRYVESHPTAFYDAEVFHVWTLGLSPYAEERFKSNFRHNSFFISKNTREAVNQGVADYTPIFLSKVPDLIRRGLVPIDIENLRLHYAATLDEWARRLESNVSTIEKLAGSPAVRMWRMYLNGSAAAFRWGDLRLYQILFANGLTNDLPLTREHLYACDFDCMSPR